MTVEGSLDLFQLPEILQIIAQEGKTGILTVQGKEDIVAISFLEGRVVAADALNQSLEDGLGEVLLENRLVDRGKLGAAIAEKERHGGRLIDILVERADLPREDLLEALRFQTYDLLFQLLAWREGEFKFYGGDEVSYETGFRPITIEEVLLRALDQEEEAEPEPAAAPPLAPPPVRPTQPAPAVEPPAPRAVPAETAVKPPRPAAKTAGEMAVGRALAGILAGVLALAAVALLVTMLLAQPVRVLLPYPWDEPVRTDFSRSRSSTQQLKIDRAAQLFFLLEGHFPNDLRRLAEENLLADADLRDVAERSYVITSREDGYLLQSLHRGEPIEEAARELTIRGNFLLDPDFQEKSAQSETPPLVLLD